MNLTLNVLCYPVSPARYHLRSRKFSVRRTGFLLVLYKAAPYNILCPFVHFDTTINDGGLMVI